MEKWPYVLKRYLNSYLIVLHLVAKSCPALCDSMDSILPISSVLHYLPELAQIHVSWVSDAIWSHPLPLPSLFAFIFPSVRVFSNELTLCIKILELKLQHQSFQWKFRVDLLRIDQFDHFVVLDTCYQNYIKMVNRSKCKP